VRVYTRKYPKREQPYRQFLTRLESRLQKNEQFRPIEPAGTHLFIKFSGNIILNIVSNNNYFYTSYKATFIMRR